MRNIHIWRTLKIAALAVAGGVSLLLVCVIFLPAFVSSHAAQVRIQQSLSSSMKRQVAWSSLVMTWKGGLTLSDSGSATAQRRFSKQISIR